MSSSLPRLFFPYLRLGWQRQHQNPRNRTLNKQLGGGGVGKPGEVGKGCGVRKRMSLGEKPFASLMYTHL